MLSYIFECENRQGIALPEKFPHCLRDIIQGFYYSLFKKVEMLHSTPYEPVMIRLGHENNQGRFLPELLFRNPRRYKGLEP